MNPQAKELNTIIRDNNTMLFEMLSERGRNIFFPKKGILGQTADAKGKKINATIGSAIEDDNTPMRLESVEKQLNISPSLAFPYAPSYGRPDIRKRWKELIYIKNPALYGKEISLPIVTSALTHALSMTGYLFLDHTDSVLMPDLYWGNYNLIFTNAYGAGIEKFNLFRDEKFDLESFEKSVTNMKSGKKIILFNFPNNPSGYTPAVNEVKSIVSILRNEAEKGNMIIAIMDDAYFGLVYEDGIEKESLFAYLADLHENLLAIKVDGPTKEDYVWGFRIGFITYGIRNGNKALYEALEAKTAGAVRGSISNACNLTQSLLMNAYCSEEYQPEKSEKYSILSARFRKVREILKTGKYNDFFTALPFNSGYFMCIRLKKGLDGERLRYLLLDKYDTGVIQMNDLIRIAFSSVAESDIPVLFENICNACREISS
ncbi:MAG: aminotransferase class I/II-fold pyridoxal phosphate-dependent enzyme [Bacteroidales bacterium]|nr:aminotransferase class I/II-fold pyridoxal phosphate-dependent enzyme [Bacteroidales bacterium]